MTTVNAKGDKAHKVVQVALLLFCVNLISGRLMVLMDSSTNADIVQVVIQKPHSLFPTLITTPHHPLPNPQQKHLHTMNTILVTKKPSDMQAPNTQ